MTPDDPLDEIERLIRRDPARRGLIATESARGPLCPRHFQPAARHLAKNGQHIAIVTGFFIPSATPAAAETDGPPGAAMLAAALIGCGMSAQIVTDERCLNAVRIAAREMSLTNSAVTVAGNTAEEIEHWFHATMACDKHPPWTHLIAIERVGPSHTRDSIIRQMKPTDARRPALLPSESSETELSASDQAELQEFEQRVPANSWNHCHNMRGLPLDEYTAPLHRLFELAETTQKLTTIGIGDGGNEIGMGAIRWNELRHRLSDPTTAHIPCRISTDWTIVTGVSNWGGMALAAAILLLRHQQQLMAPWTSRQQLHLLERLVKDGPAVDGITRLPQPTVDGLPFLTYIQPWEGIRRSLERTDA